ncbi:hypothetical protein CRE_27919 [Caenorhabditis remanei]|uniref:60S ribosomal export protein NMD3 n=1 Tax=Caenorhabditis remanei TaxID=31234 RepID=E3NL01_CAERE|nr:hypothetical protein CRE_27919 [Caenorhabditis remanei]
MVRVIRTFDVVNAANKVTSSSRPQTEDVNELCDDCRRAEAKDFWRACVQVRQRAEFKKTLFYLEQLLLKHSAHKECTGVKPVPTGIDFYFAKQQEARKFVDFLMTVLPCKYHYAQELVSHDTKNNTYDYKHTFCVEIVPICRDNIVCLPKKQAQQYGNMSQIVLCLRVSNVITLIDPNNLQLVDVQATNFWREPFDSLCGPKQLTEFYVLDVESIDNFERKAGHGYISKKHELADVWLVRSDQVGMSDAQSLSARTHLGHLLSPGDLVMAFDMKNCNVNNATFDAMSVDNVPDAIIVRKVFDRSRRVAERQWKLKKLVVGGNIVGNETASVADEFQGFMEDIEEDALMRARMCAWRRFGRCAQRHPATYRTQIVLCDVNPESLCHLTRVTGWELFSNQLEPFVKKIIEFAIDGFLNLPQETQIHLLKGSVFELCLIFAPMYHYKDTQVVCGERETPFRSPVVSLRTLLRFVLDKTRF